MILKTRFEFGDYLPTRAARVLVGGRLVRLAAGGDGLHGRPNVEHTAARNDFVYGANEYDVLAGANGSVNRNHTIMLLESDGAIAENDAVVPAPAAGADAANAGRVIAVGAGAAGDTIVGRALHSTTGAGQKVWVIYGRPNK